eukprot:CAMPEP_0194415906 /NCGR_PEP_ID=MMETSP0176-20130528/14757_1 /TAXON_ID=216777 /ORGANISM="Proboscia alata, Strain PI-D3" /LENGTH=72 /DNA_ID=CAMNT_0039220849 /DNA_START=18 /DNA_END=233 /DNA_ORIENTATION=-
MTKKCLGVASIVVGVGTVVGSPTTGWVWATVPGDVVATVTMIIEPSMRGYDAATNVATRHFGETVVVVGREW